MNEIDTSYHALGEMILEEVVVRAGLGRKVTSDMNVSLNFVVSADVTANTVLIRAERIGNPPLEIRLLIS